MATKPGTRWHACRSIVSLVFVWLILRKSVPCALSTVGRNACQRVPSRLSEPDPLIEPKPAVIATGLNHLEAGNNGAKVAPEGLRRASVIAPLLSAPIAPHLKQPRDLDGAAGSDSAALAHKSPDRRTEILQLADGIGRGCRGQEKAAFG